MDEQTKAAVLDDIDEALDNLGPTRPSAPKVTRARTLLKGIKVACQTIAISPVTDGGVSAPPPTPGPETPPVEPAPPETPPSGGGGGGSSSPPTTTTVTTTYTSNGDFVGTQGYRGWTYLDGNLADTLTYDVARQLWTGPQLYQFIWSDGCHSGPSVGVVRRFTVPASGTYSITGSIKFFNDPIGGTSALPVTIKKNGVSIYSQTVADNDIVGYAVSSLTGSVTVGDTLDFFVGPPSGPGTAHENFNCTFSIALTTTTTTGGGSSTQTTLPFTLNGTAPQEGTYTLTANKPSNADGCTIQISGVNLAAAYGRVYFNGSTNSLPIWATAPANAGISATVTLTVPVAYMVNGSNTLRFTHDSGTGYTVTAIGTPTFTTPATPTPPATQTSLPFDLRGSILPEDGILTVPLSKPSNANGATMTITGVNLTGTMGSYYINGTLASSVWTTVPANAGVSATVTRTPDVNLFVNGNNAIRFTHTAGSGYTVSSVNVTFSTPSPGTDPGPPTGNNGAFQNEPSGMTTLLNHPFNTSSGTNMIDVYNTGQIVSDASAPLSPSNVMRSRLSAGTLIGGSQIEYNSPTYYRSLFMGLWVKTNAQFQGFNIVANKMFFLKGPDTNGFFGLAVAGSVSNGPFVLGFGHNTGSVDNSHIFPGGFGLGYAVQNVSSPIFPLGTWTKVEVYIRCSSTITSRDGTLVWWINGNKAASYTTLNYPGLLQSWIWTETLGNQNQLLPNDRDFFLDHLYLSGGA